jgi:hypothetical protein
MTRQQYTTRDLGSFSEWHRSELADWYSWIDIDYLGYQIVKGEYKPYIAVERIRLTNSDPWIGPAEYPVDRHKERIYSSMSDRLDIPAYVIWHSDECEKFAIQRIDDSETIRTIKGKTELMDFFDNVAKQVFDGLWYR